MDDGRLVALGFRWYLLHAGAVHGRVAPTSSGVEKLGLKVTEDVPAGSFLATGADQDMRGQCLPDTDDPRGPKGK